MKQAESKSFFFLPIQLGQQKDKIMHFLLGSNILPIAA